MSLFTISKVSRADSSPRSDWPTTNYDRRQTSDHSVELTRKHFITDAAPIGYAVTAARSPTRHGLVDFDDDVMYPGIVVHKHVDVQTHSNC